MLFMRCFKLEKSEDEKLVVAGVLFIAVACYAFWRTSGTDAVYFPIPAVCGNLFAVCQTLYSKRLRKGVLTIALFATCVTLVLIDLRELSILGLRTWPLFVIVLDIALVYRQPDWVAYGVIAMALVWLPIAASENAYRWGLYNMMTLSTDEQRHFRCDCADPPCAVGLVSSFSVLLSEAMVFLFDFSFTRGFAHGMYREKAAMQEVIRTAEWIASCLSRFDLEAAESALTDTALPPPLHEAFATILKNLHTYRPFLPQSVLLGVSRTDSMDSTMSDLSDSEVASRGSFESPASRSMSRTVSFRLPIEHKRVSCTVSNLLGSHELVTSIPTYVVDFAEYIAAASRVVTAHKGVVGVVAGDHVHASFNAMKRCAGHAKGSVEAALGLCATLSPEVEVVTSVASGTVHCGALGSSELRSFCVIGKAVVHAAAMERFGRWRELPVVCDEAVYKEVSFAFRMKLVVAAVTLRGGRGGVGEKMTVYEVMQGGGKETKPDEWMYELRANVWDIYNEAGRALLMGKADEAARLLKINLNERPPAVAAAEAWLLAVVEGDEVLATVAM